MCVRTYVHTYIMHASRRTYVRMNTYIRSGGSVVDNMPDYQWHRARKIDPGFSSLSRSGLLVVDGTSTRVNSLTTSYIHTWGGRVVRRCWVNFQCRGVLLIWKIVGQGPIALAVIAGGVVWTFFSLIYHLSFLSPPLWEMVRYRLKYCLKGRLNPKQPTNIHTYLRTDGRDVQADRRKKNMY